MDCLLQVRYRKLNEILGCSTYFYRGLPACPTPGSLPRRRTKFLPKHCNLLLLLVCKSRKSRIHFSDPNSNSNGPRSTVLKLSWVTDWLTCCFTWRDQLLVWSTKLDLYQLAAAGSNPVKRHISPALYNQSLISFFLLQKAFYEFEFVSQPSLCKLSKQETTACVLNPSESVQVTCLAILQVRVRTHSFLAGLAFFVVIRSLHGLSSRSWHTFQV